jgi:hypothetical protein
VKKALGMQRRKGKQINLNGRSRATDHKPVVGLDFGADHLGQVKDRYWSFRFAVLLCDHGITSLPICAARIPGRMVIEPNRGFLAQNLGQEFLGIGLDWLLHVRMEFFEFRLVNIHNYLVCATSQVLRCVSCDCEIQPDTDGK